MRDSSAVHQPHLLDPRYYTDADVFAREQECIFVRTWQLAGHTEEVRDPGDYLTVEVAGESIVVIRADDGGLRAFYNVCQHRATTFAEDLPLVESVQRGLGSRGYKPRMLMVDDAWSLWSEHAVAHLQSLVLQALNDHHR